MVQRLLTNLILIAGVMLAQQDGSGGTSATSGSAERGTAIFEGKGACLTCHRVGGKGSRLGVNLTDIGELRKRDVLEKAVLDPAPEVQLQNRMYRVVTSDGTVYSGKLLNQDTASVQILDTKEHLRSFQRSGLRESGFVTTAPMPSYRNKLSSQEVTDLVAYLSQLKGVSP